MMRLTLHQDGKQGAEEYYPDRYIELTYADGSTWMQVLEGFRNALNGMGYQVPELGPASDEAWDEWEDGKGDDASNDAEEGADGFEDAPIKSEPLTPSVKEELPW